MSHASPLAKSSPLPLFHLQTDKFYDLTGSLTYLTLAGLSLSRSALAPHQLLVSGMVALWAARLGSFLFARVLHVRSPLPGPMPHICQARLEP